MNDAISRYKTEGGNIQALTAGSDLGALIGRLSTPYTWGGGMVHQFLNKGYTYPARSLAATGNAATFTLYKCNSYTDSGLVPSSYGSVVMQDSPTDFWNLNDGSGSGSATNATGGGGATVNGSVTFGQSGQNGTAATFASGGYLDAPPINDTYITVECWINTPDPTQFYGMFVTQMATFDLRFSGGSGQVQFVAVLPPGSTYVAPAGGPVLSANTWYYVAGTWDGTTATVYLNGVAVASQTGGPSGLYASNADVRIGNRQDGYTYTGKIQQVAIYPTALSPTDILAHYNKGMNP